MSPWCAMIVQNKLWETDRHMDRLFPWDPNTISQGPTTTTDAGDMLLLMFCPLLSGSHCNVRIWDSIWKETWNFMFAGNLKSYLKLSGRTRTLRVTWWNSLRMEVSRLNDDNEEEFNICMTSKFVWHQSTPNYDTSVHWNRQLHLYFAPEGTRSQWLHQGVRRRENLHWDLKHRFQMVSTGSKIVWQSFGRGESTPEWWRQVQIEL